jgi:hypothetical protein
MRRITSLAFLAVVLFGLSGNLAGCFQTTSLAISGVDNPVTVERMYQVEQVAVALVSGLNTYRTACLQKLAGDRCRDVIIQMQSFTKPAQRQLVTLRVYFRNNDKLNAINAYNTLVQLLADARAVASSNGVAVP